MQRMGIGMYSRVFSTTISGIEAAIVNVEVDAGLGLPIFEMSGYLAAQVKEARERVRVAIRNSGFELKPQKIIVNISPANLRKSGTGFDLPIAVGILAANSLIRTDILKDTVVIGELSLDGSVNSVSGIVSSVIAVKEQGFKRCIVPSDNLKEGLVIDGIEVLGTDSLTELADYFCGRCVLKGRGLNDKSHSKEKLHIESMESKDNCDFKGPKDSDLIYDNNESYKMDFSDICGQQAAKRATMIAAAGMHNIMYVGAPGSGKSMLAKRLPTILPELTFEERLMLTKIYSVAGKLDKNAPIMTKRPFRSPHHSITQAGMFGGGQNPKPGELTLASFGVLFLDELTEYKSSLLEALRQPLEDREIHISRLMEEYVYPADFMLAAAINPCRCGYYPDKSRCNCSQKDIKRFLGRISRPLWDRFDLSVQVNKVEFESLKSDTADECEVVDGFIYNSRNMFIAVNKARNMQQRRFKGLTIEFNSQMSVNEVKKFCVLTDECERLMEMAYNKFNMTARGYYKILKTARTIADIEGEEQILIKHLSEAISYRAYADR